MASLAAKRPRSIGLSALLTKTEKARAAASAKALKAEAARTHALNASVDAAERDLGGAQRAVERAAAELRSTEQQLVRDTQLYGLQKNTKPLFDTLEAAAADAHSVTAMLAALTAAVSAQDAAVAAASAACEASTDASKAAALSAAKHHAVATLKLLKGLVKNPRKLPRPAALSAWYANSREEVERVRRAASAAGDNARAALQRHFAAAVWPSPEFFDTRSAAEVDYAADAAAAYQQLAAAMQQRAAAGAKRKAGDALRGGGAAAASTDCSCCLSAPAVFACSAPEGGHGNFCAECMTLLVDGTLRPEVLAGTRVLPGATADVDAAALHACCAAGCGAAVQVGGTKARIVAMLGGSTASLAEALDQELLYGKIAEVAARSAEKQLQKALNAKLGQRSDPTAAEVKALIHELINVVKCPNCDAAYFGVTEACQHAYCPCRPQTAFCAFCFQNHSDYENCVLFPRYADDVAAEEAEAAEQAERPAVQNGAYNGRFNKLRASFVMKAHHINRVLASAPSAAIRAVLADAEVLTWLREIHVTVTAEAAEAADAAHAAEVTACPLNIDGIGTYVSRNIRAAFQQTFQACRNKPYANDHELDALIRRAHEAERAAERAAALCARLAVFDAPFTAADFTARLAQLRTALRVAVDDEQFPFRLPRSIAAARAALAACAADMGAEQRLAAKAALDELAEQSSAAFAEYKSEREASRMRALRAAIGNCVVSARVERASTRERVKSVPQRLRRAQRHIAAADAVKRAAERGVVAARAVRDAALGGRGSAAALPAVAAAVAASDAAAAHGRDAAAEEAQEQPRGRCVVTLRLGAWRQAMAAAANTASETAPDDSDSDSEDVVHMAPPRSRRRLWRPMETPEASSDDDDDDEDDEDEEESRRRRFMRMRRPMRRPAATADADGTMGSPIVISSDDEL